MTTESPALVSFDWREMDGDGDRLFVTAVLDMSKADLFGQRAGLLADLTRRLSVLLAHYANDPKETANIREMLR